MTHRNVYRAGALRVLGPKCPSRSLADIEAQYHALQRELVLPREGMGG